MKRFVSILVGSVAALAAFASPSTRQWDGGPLKWSVFKGNPAIKSTTSYFKGFLKTVTDIEHEGKTRFNSDVRFATSAVALMDCNASYADSAYRTDQMLRSPFEVIAEISKTWTLAPGDIVFTGTPAGNGPCRAGDRLEGGVNGVGQIKVELVDPKKA